MMHYCAADITSTTYLKLLSCDLMENIWWLLSDYYTKIIQKYFKKYITVKVKNICSHINKYEYHYGITAFHYLWTHDFNVLVDGKIYNKKTLFTCFNACNCCANHQIGKPKHMCDNDVLCVEITNNDVICPCRCRHINRAICNANAFLDNVTSLLG
jgi:hypothetical protein